MHACLQTPLDDVVTRYAVIFYQRQRVSLLEPSPVNRKQLEILDGQLQQCEFVTRTICKKALC